MLLHIGHCEVDKTTRELDYYFDKSQGHSWTGPTVLIKSIEFKLNVEVNASGYSKDSGIMANVGYNVIAIITDEKGRVIEKSMKARQFKERFKKRAYQQGCYLIGWSEGENKIILNEIGQAFMRGAGAQASV
jgi:hypothetical protein